MNIRHLEHLLAVADEGSFIRAAEKAFITQSALSRSIQALEAEVDGQLLDRTGKRAELTPLGKEIASRARQIVLDASELKRAAVLMRGSDAGLMRIGLGSAPGAILTVPLMCHMVRHHPKISVSIARGHIDVQLAQLRARKLDALVVDARRLKPTPDLRIEPIADMVAQWIARPSHPLAQRSDIRFDDLQHYPMAAIPISEEGQRTLVRQYGPQAHSTESLTLQCDHIDALLDVVERTDAIFLGVLGTARERIASGALKVLPVVPEPLAVAHISYVTLVGRAEAPIMEFLRDFVFERLADA